MIQVVILLLYGIIPMLIGEIFFSFVGVYLNSYFSGRDLKYGLFKQLSDIFPYVAITVPSCLAAWEFYWTVSEFLSRALLALPASAPASMHGVLSLAASWTGFILSGLVGVLVYVVFNRCFRTPALREIANLLGGRFPKVKRVLFY